MAMTTTIRRLELTDILLETDAPYIGRNPWAMRPVCQVVGNIKILPADLIAARTTINAERFFQWS